MSVEQKEELAAQHEALLADNSFSSEDDGFSVGPTEKPSNKRSSRLRDWYHQKFISRRRTTVLWTIALIGVVLVSLAGAAHYVTSSGKSVAVASTYTGWDAATYRQPLKKASAGGFKSNAGTGSSIRDLLNDESGYLLSWGGSAGWTNVVFSQLKHIHIAHLANRIPIVPPTSPSSGHLTNYHEDGRQPVPILMSEIFDLGGLAEHLGTPIVEIDELKGNSWKNSPRTDFWDIIDKIRAGEEWTGKEGIDANLLANWPPSHEADWEQMGCWGLEMTSRNASHGDVYLQEGNMKYQLLPPPVSIINPRYPPPDGHALIGDLAEAFTWTNGDKESLPQLAKDMAAQTTLNTDDLKQFEEWHPDFEVPTSVPDYKLACTDQWLFYTFPKADIEGAVWLDRTDYPTNTWNEVGRHLHWRPDVKALAMALLAQAMGLDPAQPMVDYIAIHIRRTDLLWQCERHDSDGVSLGIDPECYSPKLFRNAIEAVKRKIFADQGITVGDHIVFTTDEQDPEYLQALHDEGFVSVDHIKLNIADRLGPWWPTVLDSVLISSGKGFVGTTGSTMSEIAVRRTEDWQNGVATQVAAWNNLDTKFLGET